jgi:hypothetical protein
VRRNENETKREAAGAFISRRSVEQRTKSHASGRSKILEDKIIVEARKV